MDVWSCISQKGGSGKSTLAIHLAVQASQRKQAAAIIDIDPQESAAKWGESRAHDDPAVVSALSENLRDMLKAAEDTGADLVIIDTPPHSERGALEAARLSDLIVVPVRPAILDLRAIGDTIDLLRMAEHEDRAVIVLNSVPPRSGVEKDAAEAAESFGIPLCPVRIQQRAAFQHALTVGQGVSEYEARGRAAKDIADLYAWLRKHASK